jgi:hypothetical protein
MLAAILAALAAPASACAAGTFAASDPLLTDVWRSSVATADAMVSPPVRLDARDCNVPAGTPLVILDGVVRDRCPYIGDEAVTGMALHVSQTTTDSERAIRSMLLMFAGAQRRDGAIPSSPIFDWTYVLNDYSAYWVETLRDYVLWTGDVDLGRRLLPNVRRVLDDWYPSTMQDGLIVDRIGRSDYAYLRRRGSVVAYYNALAVRALRQGAEVADWVGAADGTTWRQRADGLLQRADAAFFDGDAYTDTTEDRVTHPQDGNAFMALECGPHAKEALDWLWRHDVRDYGNTIADSNVWDDPAWGHEASERVYPFIGYFELIARFEQGRDAEAVNMLRREWGYMFRHGNAQQMTWETIGPYGGPPADKSPSWASGWSAGAAPALTTYVLGVKPTAPGFATWDVSPHLADLWWARGSVETPHGPLTVDWRTTERGVRIVVVAPPATRGRVYLGGGVATVRGGRRVVVTLPRPA